MSTVRHLNLKIKAAITSGMRLTGTCVATLGTGTFSFYIGDPPAQPSASATWYIGTNFSGMEWAETGVRYGTSTRPNLNYTVPRKADARYIASLGFNRVRLPIQWELLQPTLSSTSPNPSISAIMGSRGSFNLEYQNKIEYVLDSCRTAGITCIIDMHNYYRYKDFSYSTDGSVTGFVNPGSPLPPYADGSAVLKKIAALTAATASCLTLANFTDVWTRIANLWKEHAGLAGYGLMNEPSEMPAIGGTDANGAPQDYTICMNFAQAAISAIRAVDSVKSIYVSANNWQSIMDFPNQSANPSLASISGASLVFEGHMYLDASSSGHSFDWNVEHAKGFSAGEPGGTSIHTATGRLRLSLGTEWARSFGTKIAIGEIGMPVGDGDTRWHDSFNNFLSLAKEQNVEVYTWMGGNHWPIHNYPINHVPGWHQRKTMEPLVSGFIRSHANLHGGAAFDYCDLSAGYRLAGATATMTVATRGNLSANLTVTLALAQGTGTLSTATIVLSAGPNKSYTYLYTPASDEIAEITYSNALGGTYSIPPRFVYSLLDPTGHAATNLSAAAHCIMAKYNMSKWDAADAYTDYMLGTACSQNSDLRAISDSGWGSRTNNVMEMLCWINNDGPSMGIFSVVPTWETAGGLTRMNLSAADCFGLWCKKVLPNSTAVPTPVQRTLFDLTDDHFAIACIQTPVNALQSGPIFAGFEIESLKRSELRLQDGKLQMLCTDATTTHTATDASTLSLDTAKVVTMRRVNATNASQIRVNKTVVASSTATAMVASQFNAMTLGFGYYNFFPATGFSGRIYACVAGKGNPSTSEIEVVERWLGTRGGLTL